MMASKIAITIDEELLKRLDELVAERKYPSRSRAIQEAVEEKLKRLNRSRLAREATRLDPVNEQELAEEGIEEDFAGWPDD